MTPEERLKEIKEYWVDAGWNKTTDPNSTSKPKAQVMQTFAIGHWNRLDNLIREAL